MELWVPSVGAKSDKKTPGNKPEEMKFQASVPKNIQFRFPKPFQNRQFFLHETLQCRDGAAPNAAASATEHSKETTSLQPDAVVIYSTMHAFLDQITLHHPQAEEMLMPALNDDTCLTPSIYLHVQEVFSNIFFPHPNGLKDRSVQEMRDTKQYIRNW